MFGRKYSQHPDLLMSSYEQMTTDYMRKARSKKHITIIEKIEKLYIFLFGIPEIGFQIRSKYFEKILGAHVRDKKLKSMLDAGCGIGAYTFWLGETFPHAHVTGGDIDKHKLISCRALAKEFHINNVSFRFLDITKTMRKTSYDLIVSIDVLEHVKNYVRALRNFHGLLHKDGILYIHVPQPHQKRIFRSLERWHHEGHVREGIDKKTLEDTLKKLGFEILSSRESFGYFGKLAWELNHMMLAKNFVLAGITFPFLYMLVIVDQLWPNTEGLGIAILAQKRAYAK